FLVPKTEVEFAPTNIWKCPIGREYGRSAIVLPYRICGRESRTRQLHSMRCVRAGFLRAISKQTFTTARKSRSYFRLSVNSLQSANAQASHRCSVLTFQALSRGGCGGRSISANYLDLKRSAVLRSTGVSICSSLKISSSSRLRGNAG